MRLTRPSLILSVALLSVLSGCFKVDDAPVAPCYPTFYSEDTPAYKYSESYSYSENNRIVSVYTDYKASNSSSYTYSSIQYIYDSNGRLTKTTAGDGSSVTYAYTNGKMTSSTVNSSSGQVTSKQDYVYNTAGQLATRQTYQLVSGTLTKGAYYTYEYPNTNTKNYSKRSFYNSSAVLQSSIVVTYDDKKNPRTVVNPFTPTNTTNNILKYIFTPVSGTPVTYTYTYTYSDTGFPRSYKISTGGSTSETYTFTYNNCDTN